MNTMRTASIQKIFCCLLLFVCLLLPSGCGAKSNALKSPYEDVPDEVYSYMVDYMEAARNGYSKVVDRDYIPEEYQWAKELTEQSPEYVIDYEIESAERVNDNLYAFILLVETDATMEKYTRVANFVGIIDGKLYRIANTSYIPESISEGLNAAQYAPENLTYEAEGKELLESYDVAPEDVMGEFDLG